MAFAGRLGLGYADGMRSLGIAICALLAAVFFQNCAQTETVTEYVASPASTSTTGLPSTKVFVNRAPEAECAGGIRAAIRVEDGQPVFEGCVDVTPRLLEAGSFSFASSDPTIMVYGDKLFDLNHSSITSGATMYCYGHSLQFKGEYQLRVPLDGSDTVWLRVGYVAPYGTARINDRSLQWRMDSDGNRKYSATAEKAPSADQWVVKQGVSSRDIFTGDVDSVDLTIYQQADGNGIFGVLYIDPKSNPSFAVIDEILNRTGGMLKPMADLRNCRWH